MLTKQQAAEFLGVNVRTLERYTQEGKIGGRYEKGKTPSVNSRLNSSGVRIFPCPFPATFIG